MARQDHREEATKMGLQDVAIHPGIAVSDMRQATEFYEGKLGLLGGRGDRGRRQDVPLRPRNNAPHLSVTLHRAERGDPGGLGSGRPLRGADRRAHLERPRLRTIRGAEDRRERGRDLRRGQGRLLPGPGRQHVRPHESIGPERPGVVALQSEGLPLSPVKEASRQRLARRLEWTTDENQGLSATGFDGIWVCFRVRYRPRTGAPGS
jgi:catechol 2,3-dioxygenase-like lactoylglutathione lyase family enzyme